MSNMSYCRFQNTLRDLRDCYNTMLEDVESIEEAVAREELRQLCVRIAEEYPDSDSFQKGEDDE